VRIADSNSIRAAAEQFLSKTVPQRVELVRSVIEGHLRHIIGHLTIEDLVNNTDYVAQQMIVSASPDVLKMGLEIVSFTIKQVTDHDDYIANLGRLQVEELRKRVAIATAHAQRDTQIATASAIREAALARVKAEQERLQAEAAIQTRAAELRQQLALKTARPGQDVVVEQLRTREVERHDHLALAQSRRQSEQGGKESEAEQFSHQRTPLKQQVSEMGIRASTLSSLSEGTEEPHSSANGQDGVQPVV
jgi:flotillin